jgi:hypothetical protein
MEATTGRAWRLLAIVLAVSVVAAGVAPAQSGGADNPAWADTLYTDLQGMAERYNENVGEARSEMDFATREVYNRLTGKPVNVYFHGTDVVFSFRMTGDGRIVDLRDAPRDDARLAMFMTRETAERLAASDRPVDGFVSAVQSGRFVGSGDDRTVRGVVIRGEQGRVVEQVTWTVINAAKGLVF